MFYTYEDVKRNKIDLKIFLFIIKKLDLLLDEFTQHINKTKCCELSYENFIAHLYCHILEGMPYLIEI